MTLRKGTTGYEKSEGQTKITPKVLLMDPQQPTVGTMESPQTFATTAKHAQDVQNAMMKRQPLTTRN